MNKITVEICYGTLCFVMGGEVFETLQEHLPEEIKEVVALKGMVCPGYCHQQEKYGKPPFVKVQDRLICEANPQKVIACITNLMKDGSNQ
jgi:NADH:ubiquinone oxidoreductase subunit E